MENSSSYPQDYLDATRKLFNYYKSLGDKALAQVPDNLIHQCPNEDSNSIAIIVKHMSGNMLSRWTNFLESDGEKSWRNRDDEFEDTFKDAEEMRAAWEKGWACLFNAIDPLKEADMNRIAYIRNEGHSIIQAMNRQLGHYAYHVGQLVFLAKILKDGDWDSLSIPKGKSKDYNAEKFAGDKVKRNFLDGKV